MTTKLASKINYSLALKDFQDGILNYHVWFILGWNDIRQKYRRSKLGPAWITLSFAIMIVPMTALYTKILNQDPALYIPYLAIGLISWNLILSLITESCYAFINSDAIIRQIKLPFSTYILRVVWRNFIIFMHNLLIIVFIKLFYGHTSLPSVFLSVLGLILLLTAAVPTGIIIAIICTRFRDAALIISSIMQITFFMTPVLWRADVLGDKLWVAQINPIFHFFEIMREPLITNTSPTLSWLFCLIFTLTMWVLAFAILARYRSRIPYWI